MKSKNVTVLFKTLEELKEDVLHLYEDYAGDYWETYDAYDYWEDSTNDDSDQCLTRDDIGKVSEVRIDSLHLIEWAVKKILTKENDPEYFL